MSRNKILSYQRFRNLSLSSKILLAFCGGLMIGLVYRANPGLRILGLKADQFKILGIIFIKLMKMIVAPLIFSSIVTSFFSIKDKSRIKSLAISSLVTFFVMTLICVILGTFTSAYLKLGSNVNINKEAIMNSFSGTLDLSKIQPITGFSSFFMGLIPSNVIGAFYNDNFLQIIFFAVFLAICLLSVGKPADGLVKNISAFSDAMIEMSKKITLLAPLAVFGLAIWLFGEQDISLLKSLGKLVLSVYALALFVVYALYPLGILLILKTNPIPFYKKTSPLQLLSFLLSSSSAVLPLSLETAQKKLGISEQNANFVIPLGATLNMNGGAIYLGMVSIFLTQLWGINLTFSDYITIITLSIAGSAGTAPIPGSCIFLLAGLLGAVNIPVEAVTIIIAVDRFLDMARTFVNVTGDILSSFVVAKLDNDVDMKIYKSNN